MNADRLNPGILKARETIEIGNGAPLSVRGATAFVTSCDSARNRISKQSLWILILLLLTFSTSGCVSKSNAKLKAQAAYLEGQQKVLAEQAAQQPAVWFRGDVRNPRVAWVEGLSLSQALLSAHYTWTSNPRLITVTRNGEVYQVSAKLLLRGEDDPLLEPGDIVDVRH
jgi:hypothetical protein